jgi:calmodulin
MPSADDITECLELFDKDNKEVVDAKELGSVLRMMGAFPSEEDLATMAAGAATIPFDKVKELIASETAAGKVETEASIKEALTVFDRDGTSKIPAAEFRHILTNLGEKLGDDEIDDMIRETGIAGNGEIDINDFAAKLFKK